MKKIVVLSVLWLLASCATKKEIVYFQDSDILNQREVAQMFEPIIETNDILHISLSSISPEALAPFQKIPSNINTGMVGNNPALQGYLVNTNGMINFQVIGELSVAGKTRKEVQELLKEMLLQYVKDIVVDVRILNFKVTVLGEVNNPGVYTISDERVTLPQAIGLAGDFGENGRRENVTVIREVDGVQKVTRIDFTKTDLFSSPFYYLKQNDVVYVEPSLKGVKRSGFIPDIPALLSLFTIVLSTVILLTR